MSQAVADDFLKHVSGDRQLQAELDSIATTDDFLGQAAKMGYVFSKAELSAVLEKMRRAESEFIQRGGCCRGVWRGPHLLAWDVAAF